MKLELIEQRGIPAEDVGTGRTGDTVLRCNKLIGVWPIYWRTEVCFRQDYGNWYTYPGHVKLRGDDLKDVLDLIQKHAPPPPMTKWEHDYKAMRERIHLEKTNPELLELAETEL